MTLENFLRSARACSYECPFSERRSYECRRRTTEVITLHSFTESQRAMRCRCQQSLLADSLSVGPQVHRVESLHSLHCILMTERGDARCSEGAGSSLAFGFWL